MQKQVRGRTVCGAFCLMHMDGYPAVCNEMQSCEMQDMSTPSKCNDFPHSIFIPLLACSILLELQSSHLFQSSFPLIPHPPFCLECVIFFGSLDHQVKLQEQRMKKWFDFGSAWHCPRRFLFFPASWFVVNFDSWKNRQKEQQEHCQKGGAFPCLLGETGVAINCKDSK